MNSTINQILLCLSFCFTQLSFGQSKKQEVHYPRIEIYTEKDYAQQFTGSDQTTDVQGRPVFMGKRIHEPYINRTSYAVSTMEFDSLLSKSLDFLPYFKEVKPSTSLKRYFELDKIKHIPEFKKQFPYHMEGYKSYSTEERFYFNSIVEYQLKQPNRVEVIWLNADQWFVNHIFYSIDLSEFTLEENRVVEEKLVKGSMTDFIRFSNIIQPKLSEGMSYLRIPTELFELDPVRLILIVSLSPGSPGTNSFDYKLEGNGKLSSIGSSLPRKKLEHYEVVSIMNQMNAINFEAYSMQEKPAPFVHDGQTSSVSAFSDGVLRTVSSSSGGEPMPTVVKAFSQKMVDVFTGKIPVETNVIVRRQIVAPQTFSFNAGKDSVVFEQMYDFYIGRNRNDVCEYQPLEIVDSMDLNKDDVKEIIFLRRCNCSTTPEMNNLELMTSGGIIIGATQNTYSSYEVWDLKAKRMIFEVPFQSEVIVTTSTSCIARTGYQYNVELKKNGDFVLSNVPEKNNMNDENLKSGTYHFSEGVYELK